MSRLRLKKVLRDLWLHRARSAMVVLAIVTGLVGAGAVLDSWALLRRITRDEYLATSPASATLHVDSVDAALLAAVRALPSVRDAQARRTVVASVQLGGAWTTALLFAAPDLAAQRIGHVVREQGSWPPPDGAVVIEQSSLEFAGLAVGDSVLLRVGDGPPVRLPVTGVARDAGLAPGWMEHVVYAFVTPATLAPLGAPTALDQLQFVVRDGALDRQAIRGVAAQVRDVTVRMGHRVRSVDVPEPGRHIHAGQMDSLLMTMGAFGVLALLMSAFLVVNLVTAMLAGQLREIGVMKAIGARPSQLAVMYLGLALALGLVATVIAIPVAALLGREYARFSAQLLNFTVEGQAIPRLAIVVQLATGLLLPTLAAAIPVLRGSRIPVAEALRDIGIDGGGATPAWLDRVRGPRRPLLLSLRNAFRRRHRMALTLVTLALGGAAFLGALDLRAAIRSSVGNLYGELLRFDMAIRLDGAHAADSVLAVVARVDGVAVVELWSGVRAALVGEDGLDGTFSITAVPPDSRLIALPVLAGRWLRDGDVGALVVNPRLMEEQPSLALGREVTLATGARSARWRVVGVVEAGPAPAAYMTRAALTQATGDARGSTVVIRAAARGAEEQSALIVRVRDALEAGSFPVASSQSMSASRHVIEDHLLMVAGFLLLMSQLTIVVGGLGLASTMSLAVLERTREIGVLRAIGAAPRTIMAIVQIEGLVIALLSWAIAVPLSLPISVLLGRAFSRIMMPVPVVLMPQVMALAEWLALVVAVSLVACAWPASRATRIPTAAALAYE
ncbi:MAG: FtsX-like permease family protein [Gemmatimonadetes bacterium]|nr:FtsX-like permease family protein [Gemmatimonadota bacterium]